MERIFQIRLAKITDQDFIKFFNIRRFNPDRINVTPSFAQKKYTHDDFWEATSYRVYDLNHNMMGKFEFTQFSEFTKLSFYIENDKYRQAFLEYISSTVEEMELHGFIILDTREFCENNINLENDESVDTSEEISAQANKPWEQIDEGENYKKMVRLIHEGLSPQAIADEFIYDRDTIYKRTSELRQKYGCKIVPYFQKWRKCED